MANAPLKAKYEEYCAFGRSKAQGPATELNSKNFMKLMKDAGLVDKKLNQTEVDMIFTKSKTKGTKGLTYPTFQDALKHVAKVKGKEDNVDFITEKLANMSTGPSVVGTTKTTKKGGVEKLTDTTKYTGSHKERFDESGKGKGKEGRSDLAAQDGYVGGYKKKDTYDEAHKK